MVHLSGAQSPAEPGMQAADSSGQQASAAGAERMQNGAVVAAGSPRRKQRAASQQQQSRGEKEQCQHGAHHAHPLGMAAVVVAGVWGGLTATIKVFHLARRCQMRQMLLDVAPVLNQLGVTYWADFGTLLGLHREHDLIEHDNDVDLAVLDPDWDALAPALRARLPGYRVAFISPSEDRRLRWLRVYCLLGVMDLYGAYDRGANNLAVEIGHGDLCDIPRGLVLPTSKLTFRGVSISVPSDVPAVLRERYGPGFMTPRYMDKGRDTVEQRKPYARALLALSRVGICV